MWDEGMIDPEKQSRAFQTMTQHGGARPGAGRKWGGRNRATVERQLRAQHGVQAATEDGVMPLDVMLAMMRDEPLSNGRKPTDEQLRAAIAAAPYLHPRLATTTINATVANPVKPPLDPEKLPLHLRGPLEEIMLWCDAQHRSEAGRN
jgi:hypothetical protein